MADGRVQRGEHTRQAVVTRAMDIASVEGLEGLSIGRLATELGVSKSGVFAHFGSKEELQLATVRAAMRVFYACVVEPTLGLSPGAERTYQLFHRWLEYSSTRVFAGGCFFAAVSAVFGARPGRVRDLLAEADRTWMRLLVSAVEQTPELPGDSVQWAFELNAFVHAANAASLLHGDDAAYERADRAVRFAIWGDR